MQFYKGKEYMERDLHVLNEKGQQEVLRIMDEDFFLLNEGSISAPDDWKEIKNTVSLFLPLDNLMMMPDEEAIAIINEKKGTQYKARQIKKKKWFNPSKN